MFVTKKTKKKLVCNADVHLLMYFLGVFVLDFFRNLGFSLDCSATSYNPLKKNNFITIGISDVLKGEHEQWNYITPLKVSHGPAGVLSLR